MAQSRILKTGKINWREAKWFQNSDLKELTPEAAQKLKESLRNNGFVMPFNVWEDNKDIWILDGHHRQRALEELDKESPGLVPEVLDATFIDCTDRREAAKLVLVYTSQYAKLTHEGLFSFININGLDFNAILPEVEFPDFSTERFGQKFDLYGLDGESEGGDEDGGTYPDTEAPCPVKEGDMFMLGRGIVHGDH